MKYQCAGTGSTPSVTDNAKILAGGMPRLVTIGSCATCGAWITVRRNGTLHRHMNMQLRHATQQQQGAP